MVTSTRTFRFGGLRCDRRRRCRCDGLRNAGRPGPGPAGGVETATDEQAATKRKQQAHHGSPGATGSAGVSGMGGVSSGATSIGRTRRRATYTGRRVRAALRARRPPGSPGRRARARPADRARRAVSADAVPTCARDAAAVRGATRGADVVAARRARRGVRRCAVADRRVRRRRDDRPRRRPRRRAGPPEPPGGARQQRRRRPRRSRPLPATAQRHATPRVRVSRLRRASAIRVRRSEAAAASSLTAVSDGSTASMAASRSGRG